MSIAWSVVHLFIHSFISLCLFVTRTAAPGDNIIKTLSSVPAMDYTLQYFVWQPYLLGCSTNTCCPSKVMQFPPNKSEIYYFSSNISFRHSCILECILVYAFVTVSFLLVYLLPNIFLSSCDTHNHIPAPVCRLLGGRENVSISNSAFEH